MTEWKVAESLVLAQAVYKYGMDNWLTISRFLKAHPIMKRSPSLDLFSAKNCSLHFTELLSLYQAQTRANPSSKGQGTDMPAVVQLARKLHTDRIEELKQELKHNEELILNLLNEMDNNDAMSSERSLSVAGDQSFGDSTHVAQTTSISCVIDDQRNADINVSIEQSPVMDPMDTTEDNVPQSIIIEENDTNQSENHIHEADVNVEDAVYTSIDLQKEELHAPTRSITASLSNQDTQVKKIKVLLNLSTASSSLPSLSPHHKQDSLKKGRRKKHVSAQNEPMDESLQPPLQDTKVEEKERIKSDETQKNWKRTAMMLWNRLSDHKCGSLFMHTVREDNAPDYYKIVKRPTCLLHIKNKIKDGELKTTAEFYRDVLLVFTNALVYNPIESDMYQRALEMQESARQEFENIMFMDRVPSRRKSALTSIELREEEDDEDGIE